MQYKQMGKNGLRLSELALGGWITFGNQVEDEKTARSIIHKAYDAGINFFDIADVYARGESEKAMGKILADFPRHTLVISSKVFWPMSDDTNDKGLSRKHIFESIHKSLKRIGTDYLDIYYCHRYDENTPVEETVRIMDDLIRQGKILYWGTSEWSGEQIREAHGIARQYNCYPPAVEQPQYHLLARKRFETEIAPTAKELGMGLTTFSPLALGILTGKYDDGLPQGSRLDRESWLRGRWLDEESLNKVRDLKNIAHELGLTRAQLAIAWLLRQPNLSSVITGASSLKQLEDNLGSLNQAIPDELVARIESLFPL
jgi:voltage-dependent potassium channel beta subunit